MKTLPAFIPCFLGGSFEVISFGCYKKLRDNKTQVSVINWLNGRVVNSDSKKIEEKQVLISCNWII